ncbi:transmembrane protein 132D-like [Astyanax mexicanus]|uniref:Transmembrane protein 132D-like n=1 Tax=Astyanax mexicanus TaxID=7994 RepID=A0A8T2LFK9_ASTMX|nr:transmembrane protein 132D-like [Astyanax mexicanus]
MSGHSRAWRILQMLLAMVVPALVQELDSQEVSDVGGSSSPYPMFLPVNYQVRDADYFLLKEAGQDIMRNSSMQSHTQPFVVLRAERLPVVNASYGPLSTEREIPLDLVQSVQLFRPSPPVFTFNWKVRSFVLTRWVYSSSPKVRVLFYIAGRDWDRGTKDKGTKDELPCVTVYAFWQTQEVRGSCLISNERGTCMAEVEPPAGWFSPTEGTGASSRERQGLAPGNPLELYYQAQPSKSGSCGGGLEGGKRWGTAGVNSRFSQVEYVPMTPMQRIGSVCLLQVRAGATPVSVLRLGEAVVIQTSSKPLRKTDIASFYVYMRSSANLDTFSLRAMVKKGVSFRTATPSNTLLWDITLDTGSDGSVGVICQKRSSGSGKRLSKLQAILQMDFEVEDVSSQSEIQVIKWELALPDDVKMLGASEGLMRIYTTQRDFVGLAPLVMDTELMNTAVLTGKRVVVPVRTVAVETDGSVTDVSDFTDCSSTDEDVLKVSDRCDFVYVNGKETKGRVRMLVNFTYSYLSAQLEMKVWIPRLPLDIEVSDTELSQIKNWRIPITSNKSRLGWSSEEERKGRGCMLQFQHALVRVLTHFVAEQSDPREPQAYFLGSDWQVDVTKLVRYFLKVEDPSIVRLQAGRVLSGRDVGTTSIKVLSPLSDSVLGEKMIRVLDERVSITELGLQLVSGLTLNLQLSTGSNRAISATATTQEVLNSPKQEAMLSSWLQFSDGSLTPLDIYDPTHYRLTVTSLDEGVISIRDSPLAVVAEGEGQGALVRAEMAISEVCQKTKRKSTLSVGSGSLTVKFQINSRRAENSSNNNSVDGSGTGSIAVGNAKDNSSDYGNDGEETDGDKKQQQPEQVPSRSSALEREESAVRKITTTTKSTSRASSAGSLANDLDVGGANDASAGVSKPGNILNNENILSPARPGRDSSTRNLDNGVQVTESTGKAPGNLLNYNNYPAQVEVPVQEPKNDNSDYGDDGESEGPLTNRPLTDLEIGMYALLCVFCLAILVFLVNCISYLVKFRHKQPPSQAPEHTGHRHDWVWLGTDAELVMNVPGSPLQQDTHSTTVIDIGPNTEPCGTLTRRTSCQVASVSGETNVGCVGSLRNKSGRSESLHSPTSKRKRVQFTTFTSLDRQNSPVTIPRENGHGIQWVGKEENCASPTPEVPRTTEPLQEL